MWELEEQGQREQEGHEMGMEVEAERLFGVWAPVEYLRGASRRDDGGRGCEPGRKVGAMSIDGQSYDEATTVARR